MSNKKESRGDEDDLTNIRDILINAGLNDNHEDNDDDESSEDEKLNNEKSQNPVSNDDKKKGDGLYTDYDFKQTLHEYFSEEQVVWKRIMDADRKPIFYQEFKKIPLTLIESRIGTSALSSAIQLIMRNKEIFDQVVPKNQNFGNAYNGSFTFRFWKYGKWETITVDDFMPYDYKSSEPLFSIMASGDYWFSLLEKAYAKFYGKYSNLFCLTLDDALLNITGGVVESYNIDNCNNIDAILNQSFINKSLIGLIVHDTFVFKVLGQRITSNEVYCLEEITKTNEIFYKISKPMNVKYEYISHSSLIDLSSLHLYIGNEWKSSENNVLLIPINLIKKHFKSLKIITIPNFDINTVESGIKIWNTVNLNGSWTVKNGGGNPQFLQTFMKNPQYRFQILNRNLSDSCIVMIELSTYQYSARSAIGFALFDINCLGDELNSIELDEHNCKLIGNYDLDGKRHISKRFKLFTGYYVLVPCTSLADTKGNFFIRIFHESYIRIERTPHQLLNFRRMTKIGLFTGIIVIIFYYLYNLYTE